MLTNRLIPVLILLDGQIVQSKNFEHTNLIHTDPVVAVEFFSHWDADEIIFLDVSRNTNSRSKFYECLRELSNVCFAPLTAGGWVTSLDEVKRLIQNGADKVIINTEAFRRPEFITEVAEKFGSQCVVVSIDYKIHYHAYKHVTRQSVYVNRGEEQIYIHPLNWAHSVERFGAGEIFLTCINNEGTNKGYDLFQLKNITECINIPLIAFGGVANWQHLVDGLEAGADAVAVANIIHYTEHSLKHAKKYMLQKGCNVRV